MEIRNILRDVKSPLEVHEDNRGVIADIFYKGNIEHVATVRSKKGVRRGDHYHKETVQHMLMTKGSLICVYAPVENPKLVKWVHAKEGDIVTNTPYEIHTLLFPEDNEFIVFSAGVRGGSDYEKDTYRVSPLELPADLARLVSSDPSLTRQKHEIRK